MASGWNLWVWLECICVVSWCCYMEVYIYIDILIIIITFPSSTCISSFLAAASLLKCFCVLVLGDHTSMKNELYETNVKSQGFIYNHRSSIIYIDLSMHVHVAID